MGYSLSVGVKLEELHPDLLPLCEQFLKEADRQDIDLIVTCAYRSNAQRNARLLVGGFLFYDGNQNQSYDQYVNRGTVFPATDGEWCELVIGSHRIGSGEYRVRLSHSHNLEVGSDSIEVDCFIFRPLN